MRMDFATIESAMTIATVMMPISPTPALVITNSSQFLIFARSEPGKDFSGFFI